jgi:hypothetical protein
MSAKLGFAAGLAVGVLAGSRAGRGIYDRSAAAASAVVHDPRVRSGASAALHRAGSAGSTVAGAAARKVTGRGAGDADTDAEGDGSGESGGGGDAGKRGRSGRGRKSGRAGGSSGGRLGGIAGRGRGRGRIGESVAGESRVEHRVRMKRLMGAARSHRHGEGAGVADGAEDSGYAQAGVDGRGRAFSRHWNHSGFSNHSHVGVSAPSVQAKPKGAAEGLEDEGGRGE